MPITQSLHSQTPNPNGVVTQTPVNQTQNDKDQPTRSTLYETVKQGGDMMIVILLLAIVSLTIVLERTFFFIFSKTWHSKQITVYLTDQASKSDAKYREELEEELESKAQVFINKMEKGLNLLNGIGNLAPIVGFFGTVVGMIEAFAAIAAATTVNAKVVAVGIQVALVTTAGGLAVAVPTLLAYYFFIHLVQKAYAQADEVIANCSTARPRFSQNMDHHPESTGLAF